MKNVIKKNNGLYIQVIIKKRELTSVASYENKRDWMRLSLYVQLVTLCLEPER